jgi:predicted small lipoprotein YifL
MRRPFPSLLLAFFVLSGAAGCGQKGPLYLSDNPPSGSKPAANKSYKPVPYPEQKPDSAQGQPQNN